MLDLRSYGDGGGGSKRRCRRWLGRAPDRRSGEPQPQVLRLRADTGQTAGCEQATDGEGQPRLCGLDLDRNGPVSSTGKPCLLGRTEEPMIRSIIRPCPPEETLFHAVCQSVSSRPLSRTSTVLLAVPASQRSQQSPAQKHERSMETNHGALVVCETDKRETGRQHNRKASA